VKRLAVHDGELTRKAFLPFHRPLIEDADIEAVADALRSGWLTHGPLCRRFEDEFARRTGAAHAVSVSSGTAAMHLSLVALGIGPGDEVITTPFTFCSTAHVIEHVGATPVFVDIEPETMQIDPKRIEASITGRTRAVMPIDFGGHPCDLTAITASASERGIPVVEDAAHSLGASLEGRPIGSLARVTCFSFYATKSITTGEGGMATTNDGDLAAHLESLRLHGISRDAWNRYDSGGSWYYEVAEPGFKANLTDVQAALGLSQLSREPEMRARRTEIAGRYTAAFDSVPDLLQPPSVAPWATPAWHLYPLRLRLEQLTLERSALIVELEELGIGTSVHFIPLHMQPHFRERFGFGRGDFPYAEDAFDRIISLPLYPAMSDADVERVIDGVLEVAVDHAR
jgi:dTDP-4-amino-4,6-dideoxygalactose transaminase